MSAAAILLIVCSVWMGLSVERIVPYPLQLSAIPMSLLFTPPAALLRIYTGLAFPGGPGTIACNLASTAIRAGCEYAWRAVGEPGGPSITVDGNVHAVFVSAGKFVVVVVVVSALTCVFLSGLGLVWITFDGFFCAFRIEGHSQCARESYLWDRDGACWTVGFARHLGTWRALRHTLAIVSPGLKTSTL